MEREAEVACRSGAAESLLLEPTGVEMHAQTLSHITAASSVNVVQRQCTRISMNMLSKV